MKIPKTEWRLIGISLLLFWIFYIWRMPWVSLAFCAGAMALCHYKIQRYFHFFAFLASFLFLVALVGLIPFMLWPWEYILIGFLLHYFWKKHLTYPEIGGWKFNTSWKALISIPMIVAPSILALTWFFKTHPQLAKQFTLPAMSPTILPFALIAIAIINGFREEFSYRFVVQKYLSGLVSVPTAILVQAMAFGFFHFHKGFPSGFAGVGLTLVFGLLMGAQYQLFKSKSLVWLTHTLVDFLMFLIIISAS